jgi:hypothetical protein
VEAVEKPSIASGRQIMGNLGILAVPKGWLPNVTNVFLQKNHSNVQK